MKRREFLGTVGAVAGTAMGANLVNAQSQLNIEIIEKSVKASFGSGFQVLHAQQKSGQVIAVIEHLENRLEVTSRDLTDWTVLRATEM